MASLPQFLRRLFRRDRAESELAREMEHQHLTKTQMARRMCTSRSSLERLLDPRNEAVTLQTLDKADTPALRKFAASSA